MCHASGPRGISPGYFCPRNASSQEDRRCGGAEIGWRPTPEKNIEAAEQVSCLSTTNGESHSDACTSPWRNALKSKGISKELVLWIDIAKGRPKLRQAKPPDA